MANTLRNQPNPGMRWSKRINAKAIGQLAFDALASTATIGIWGFILSMMILKWVMP